MRYSPTRQPNPPCMFCRLATSQPAYPTILPHSLWSRHTGPLGVLGLSKLAHALPFSMLGLHRPTCSQHFLPHFIQIPFPKLMLSERLSPTDLSKRTTLALLLRPPHWSCQPSPCLILLRRIYFHVKGNHVLVCLVSVSITHSARRPNQSILKEISHEYSLQGLILKLKFQYLGHLM